MPADISVDISGIDGILRKFGAVSDFIAQLDWLVLRSARNDILTLYRQELKFAIDDTTRRRTGDLRAVSVRSRLLRNQRSIRYNPNFPRTQYNTPLGRGRPTSSKSGQYAYVVNHRREFIRLANRRTEESAQLKAIINKHLDIVISNSKVFD